MVSLWLKLQGVLAVLLTVFLIIYAATLNNVLLKASLALFALLGLLVILDQILASYSERAPSRRPPPASWN